jgi:hypothetical protein
MPDGGAGAGEVVYIPAGTPVEERTTRYPCVHGAQDWVFDNRAQLRLYEQFPQDELRLAADVCLPYHFVVELPGPPYDAPLPGHPRSWELAEAWTDTCGDIVVDGPLHIGGYASHECTEVDPVEAAAQDAAEAYRQRAARSDGPGDDPELPAPEDWILLAQWDCGLTGREGSTLHWVIPRQDLAERRFDRAHVSFFWNP